MVSLAFHSSSPSRARILRPQRPSTMQRLGAVFGAAAAEWRIRRTVKAVAAMDPHMLEDIGLASGGIEDAVRHGR